MSTTQQHHLAELQGRLASEVAALESGDGWTRWLRTAARFHHYSFNNQLLIQHQRPDATLVAGYSAWRDLGRYVNRGEKGILIIAPVMRTLRPAADDEVTAIARERVGWRVAHVWDVGQTSGDPLPVRPTPKLLIGEAPPGLWDALAAEVTTKGFAVQRGDCPRANGYTDLVERIVRVDDDLDNAQAVKTLAHELGHVLLHDTPEHLQQVTSECRGTAEVEAESFAYLIASTCGLDTDGYTFPYIASWASRGKAGSSADLVRSTAERVLRAADSLIDRVTSGLHASGDDDRGAVMLRAVPVERPPLIAARVEERPAPLDLTAIEVDPSRLRAAHVEAASLFQARLLDPRGSAPRRYLADRGLGHVVDDPRWEVGYAPRGWTTLTERLRVRGFTDDELVASGLSSASRRDALIDRFRDRVMIGIHDDAGDLVAFIGRAAPSSDDRVPKYLNSPRTAIYTKSQVVFGLGEQRERLTEGALPAIVEGPMDVFAIDAMNAPASRRLAPLAPCGTALTRVQVERLSEVAQGAILVAFDDDAPGRTAAARAYSALRDHFGPLHTATLPNGADPADLVAGRPASDAAQQLLGNVHPLADLVIDEKTGPWLSDLDNAEARVAALKSAASATTLLQSNDVARQAARLEQLLGFDNNIVSDELAEAAKAHVLTQRPARRTKRLDRPPFLPPKPPPEQFRQA